MKNILVIEDEELLSQIFGDTLQKTGYNVKIANDAATAIKIIETFVPDLVLLDIKLPDMSGIELLKKIREKNTTVPVIMCTAYDAFRTDYDKWSSLVSDYIVKPVVLEDLKTKIAKIIGADDKKTI